MTKYLGLWGLLLERLTRRGGFARARIFADKMIRFLNPGDTVLNIGSGMDHIAVLLYTNYHHRVQMYNIIPHWSYVSNWLLAMPMAEALSKRHWIPYRVGRESDPLPFKNRSFTMVLLAFSLHHTTDVERLFREAARIAKTRIIVFEAVGKGQHTIWRALFLKHGFQVRHEEHWALNTMFVLEHD